MEIWSADRQSFLRLLPHAPETPGHPQLTFAAQMTARGFSGRRDDIGVLVPEMRRFVSELVELEQHRSGSVSLYGMSPGEFSMAFNVIDRAGHIGVVGKLGTHTYVADKIFDLGVSIVFELDPSALPAIAEDFRASFLPS